MCNDNERVLAIIFGSKCKEIEFNGGHLQKKEMEELEQSLCSSALISSCLMTESEGEYYVNIRRVLGLKRHCTASLI